MPGSALNYIILFPFANLVLSLPLAELDGSLTDELDEESGQVNSQITHLYGNVYRIVMPDAEGNFIEQQVQVVDSNELEAIGEVEPWSRPDPRQVIETKMTGPNAYMTWYTTDAEQIAGSPEKAKQLA